MDNPRTSPTATPSRAGGARPDTRMRRTVWLALVTIQTFAIVASLLLPAAALAKKPSPEPTPPPTEQPSEPPAEEPTAPPPAEEPTAPPAEEPTLPAEEPLAPAKEPVAAPAAAEQPGAAEIVLLAGAPADVDIPTNYFTVIDQGGPNDEVSQSDLTQMGRDDEDPDVFKLFWSWDSTDDWTGQGQTGDACALFDNDGDGNINQAICVRVENPDADTTVVNQVVGATDGDSPFVWTCSDAKDDRCTKPSGPLPFEPTDLQSGPLVPAAADPAGNLITNTDPFPNLNPDQNWPNDSTIAISVLKSYLQQGSTGPVLVNVCSFPSAGNGGNNDPKDCIVTPGGGFLVIDKVAPDGTTQTFNFAVTGDPPGAPPAVNISDSVTGSGWTDKSPISLTIDDGYSVAETIPTGWQLDSASCAIEDNGPTGTWTAGDDTVAAVEIKSGKITTCTFENSLTTGTLTLVKVVNNLGESGPGYLGVSDFPLSIDGTATTSGTPVTVLPGNRAIAETPQSGYSVGTWSCTDGTLGTAGSATATVNITGGENTTCTITNTLIANPVLTVEKSSATTSLSAPGTVTYSYLVTNTGNVTLTGITVVDDNDNDDMVCEATTLAVGGSMTCTATHTFSQAELDANGSPTADSGVLYNNVTADSNESDPATDFLSIPITQSASMTVEKSSTTTSLSAPGTVTYSYLVTNTGNVTLTGITVVDDNDNDDMVCEATTLAVGGSMTCTATHTFSQAELDANGSPTADSGVLYNNVTADSNESDPATDFLSIPITQSASMTVEKSSTTTSLSAPGTVTYSYLVTNTGNVTLTGITVVDDNDNDDMVCEATTLAVGGSMTCTATHTFSQAELDANGSPTADSGVLYNNVTADSNESDPATDFLSIPITQSASMTVEKSSTTTSLSAPGTVTYSYLVTNTGNVTLTGITVVDDNDNDDMVCEATTLAVGGSMTCTATHTFSQAELDANGSRRRTAGSSTTTSRPTPTRPTPRPTS